MDNDHAVPKMLDPGLEVQEGGHTEFRQLEDDKDSSTVNDKQLLPEASGLLMQGYQIHTQERSYNTQSVSEVKYGDKKKLVKLSSIWENFKALCHGETRAEGVILSDFKDTLIIANGRYNKDFQWVKESDLGNGMSGICFLAKDIITGFQFCIKELCISNYKKEEIELLSELDHPNIVQIYGAIQHGERIFIFQEFIDGGSLTKVINMQKRLNYGLSQIEALCHFRQILEVLVYLKSRNILHEDLKADNILLKTVGDNEIIKLADFGLASRCQDTVPIGKNPVGTQTQWSPEKAKSVGYGFPAEVWAGVCVLIHMLSGWPPWIKRYPDVKTLIYLIVEYSPPIDDIPTHIDDQIKDLIVYGFTVCQGERPSAEVLLKHAAFRLLETEAVGHLAINDWSQHSDNDNLMYIDPDLDDVMDTQKIMDNDHAVPKMLDPGLEVQEGGHTEFKQLEDDKDSSTVNDKQLLPEASGLLMQRYQIHTQERSYNTQSVVAAKPTGPKMIMSQGSTGKMNTAHKSLYDRLDSNQEAMFPCCDDLQISLVMDIHTPGQRQGNALDHSSYVGDRVTDCMSVDPTQQEEQIGNLSFFN